MPYPIKLVWLVVGYFILSTMLWSQSSYQYSYIPKTVYKNQLFPVTIMGLNTYPTFTFDSDKDVQPIFSRPLTVNNGTHTFFTFYFKAKHSNMQLPPLHIKLKDDLITLPSQNIFIKDLPKDEVFSSVLAADMKIVSQQVSNYDGKNHMVTLSLEAYEANIEDMYLQHVRENGIENIRRRHAKVTAKLYAIIPRKESELTFSYFNTVKERFITLYAPVKVSNSSVTTQSDLNPKVDAFDQLKRYALIILMLFFIIMFVWKKDFFYFILSVISLITLLSFYIPYKEICVKQGTALYILPTETSTISRRIDKHYKSVLLDRHNDYIKIEYKDNIIGWIKNENTCEN